MAPAILASVLGAPADESTVGCVDCHGSLGGNNLASLGLQDSEEIDGTHPGFVLFSLFGGERPLGAFVSEGVDPTLYLCWRPQIRDPASDLWRETP
jgi:hypothetical protein